MSGVAKEQIARAREIDLLSYLQAYEPQELKPDGAGRYTTVSHDSLVISRGKWIWNSGGVGGVSALDYLTQVRGMGFVEAVERLAGERAAVIPAITPKAGAPPEKRSFYPPKPYRYGNSAVSYLQSRGISPEIIARCISQGVLYESRYYNPQSPYHNAAICVFAGKDEAGKIRFAAMRGIDTDLKQDKAGSDKRYNFCVSAKNPASTQLAIFEAPIDLLSHMVLEQRIGAETDTHRLSLGGTSSVALIAYLERNPQIAEVMLCLDDDEAGHKAVKSIQSQLAADERFSHIRTTVCLPSEGKDFNEALLHAIQREREPPSRPGDRAAISI